MTLEERKMFEEIEKNTEAWEVLNSLWNVGAWKFSDMLKCVYDEYCR